MGGKSVFFRVIPWVLAVVLGVFTLVTWRQLRGTRRQLQACVLEGEALAAARQEDVARRQGIRLGAGPGTEEKERTPGRRRRKGAGDDADGGDGGSGAGWFQDPAVQREIRRRAAELAEGLSEQKVEEFKEDRRGRRMERRAQFMNMFETAAARGVNAYVGEAGLDEAEAGKLHGLFEDGRKRHEDLFRKMQDGEISRHEFRTQSRQEFDTGRRAVEELLGTEGTLRLNVLIGEEMEKEMQKRPFPEGDD